MIYTEDSPQTSQTDEKLASVVGTLASEDA
jgi:hypothetical protein